jgi:hypothetical protein
MISVRLPAELVDQLEQAKVSRGASTTKIVTEALQKDLEPQLPANWPPAFFGIGVSGDPDGSTRVDEYLAEGFGR